jgi:hypothetical protein
LPLTGSTRRWRLINIDQARDDARVLRPRKASSVETLPHEVCNRTRVNVTQADGTIRSRAMVLHDAFVARSLLIERMVVDSARLRVTDTFITRNGQWQAVASHATTLAR